MTFGLTGWLKSKYRELDFDIPVWFPIKDQPDHREWLVTNGLGGYASGTLSTAHTRRYHGLLIAAIVPPERRYHVLTRLDEILTVDGEEYSLATNHWASGVVSPTGYKLIESFTTLPVPTWVFEINGHYLVKQICLKWGTNEVYVGYWWLPDFQQGEPKAEIFIRCLTSYRNIHHQVQGSSDDRYPQFVSPHHSVIILNESEKRLCLTWSKGAYKAEKQWWWDFHWPEEAARNLVDREDLFLVGSLRVNLEPDELVTLAASLDKPIDKADAFNAVESTLLRQKQLIKKSNLPRSLKSSMLVLAADQFIAAVEEHPQELTVLEGYPWFNESGRAAMIALPGLTISTRRFDDAKRIMNHFVRQVANGFLPCRRVEESLEADHTTLRCGAADVTLWWGWALYKYFQITKDKEYVLTQLPIMVEAAGHYLRGTNHNVSIDPKDGLLKCTGSRHEYSWMDTCVADIPITPRSGKAVELCALWYNFLETILSLSSKTEFQHEMLEDLKQQAHLCKNSMQRFWNSETDCLFDVIEPASSPHRAPDPTIRPNQVFAVALPFRPLEAKQERAILHVVERDLLISTGLRSLSPADPGYQGMFGCGLTRPDQYHRDLSYHQGTAWTWLLGLYCDAIVNVYGLSPETTSRITLVIQPLLEHLQDEACLGSISELFDGARPHLARGATASSWAVGETLRWYTWQARQ
jgi:4-alpha-glucanotransferase